MPQVLRWSAAGAAVCGAALHRVGSEAAQGREAGAVEIFSRSVSSTCKKKKSKEIRRNQ